VRGVVESMTVDDLWDGRPQTWTDDDGLVHLHSDGTILSDCMTIAGNERGPVEWDAPAKPPTCLFCLSKLAKPLRYDVALLRLRQLGQLGYVHQGKKS